MLVERSPYKEIISSTVLDVMMPPLFLRSLAACIIVACNIVAGAATAQQNDSSFRFNLFDFKGVYVQTIETAQDVSRELLYSTEAQLSDQLT